MSKINILMCGWSQIPHSYALVNVFQMVHLAKFHGEKIALFRREEPYFREQWSNNKKLVFNEEYKQILRGIPEWKGEKLDLIYKITFPYDLSPTPVDTRGIPKCVFYTSEFAALDVGYFKFESSNRKIIDDEYITNFCKSKKEFYFTSPSNWSAQGMRNYGVPDEKNRVITHGVDTNIFYKLDSQNRQATRKSIRTSLRVSEEDVLVVNIGAMTKNKGMMEILQSFHVIVNVLKRKNYKLLLKGTADLYDSKRFLEIYFEELQQGGVLNKDDMANLIENNIIFLDKTFSYKMMNDIFNSADVYLSPYIAEGFNLVALEALSSGLSVIVPKTGSTEDYIRNIKSNGGHELIHELESEVVTTISGKKHNILNIHNIVDVLITNEQQWKKDKDNNVTKQYIDKTYSWKVVSDLLFDYLQEIVQRNS